MAIASNRQQREVIDFPPNQPVTVALKYNQGRKVTGQYGDRMMFSTVDDRIFFTDIPLAAQIESAGINVRENFTITMKQEGKGPRTWEVARISSITPGEQPNGTFAVPALPKPPASATSAERLESAAERLVRESIVLVDAYAAVLDHALRHHEGRLKPDEVKSIFLTSVINICGGKSRAA